MYTISLETKCNLDLKCLLSPEMKSIQKHMTILVSAVITSVVYETYKLLADDPNVDIMFAMPNCIITTSKVFAKVYTDLTKHLNIALTTGVANHIYVLVNNIAKKYTVFLKDISYVYILNACMQLAIVVLCKLEINANTINNKLVTKELIAGQIAVICKNEPQFVTNYFPSCEMPITNLEIKYI